MLIVKNFPIQFDIPVLHSLPETNSQKRLCLLYTSEMAEGYIKNIFLAKNDEICGYELVHMGKFMDEIKKGTDANEALKKVTGTYGRVTPEQGAVKHLSLIHILAACIKPVTVKQKNSNVIHKRLLLLSA